MTEHVRRGSGERDRKSASNWVWPLPALACSVAAVSGGAALMWVAAGSDAPAAAVLIPAMTALASTIALSVYGPVTVWRRFARGSTPLRESVPRSVSTAVGVLPTVASLSGAVLSLMLVALGFTFGENPLLAAEFRWIILEAILFALAAPLIAPWVAVQQVRDELQGRRVPLFDASAPLDAVEASVEEAWQELVAKKRRWARAARIRALGSLENPPASAWPSAWARSGLLGAVRGPRTVVGAQAGAWGLGIGVLMIVVPLEGQTPAWPALEVAGAVAVVLASVTFPLMAITCWACAVLLGEQNRAEVIRSASVLVEGRRARENAAGPSAASVGEKIPTWALARRFRAWLHEDENCRCSSVLSSLGT